MNNSSAKSNEETQFPQVESEPTRKKSSFWLKRLAIIVAIAIAGWFWFNPPLNQSERKLIGRWERSESKSNMTISKYIITYNADRTWFLDYKSEIPAKNGKPAEVHQGAAYGKWKLKRGNITLDDDRTATGRSYLLGRRFLSTLKGKKFIDQGLHEGKFRFLSPSEMQIQWYDPYLDQYDKFEDNTWKRIE